MYSSIDPYDQGMMDVGDGNQVYWEVSGDPQGKPALIVHGGPGGAASPNWRRHHDPEKYQIVLFHQRGCGKSLPNAGEVTTDLSVNTTDHLIADMEQLREHLGIDRWQLVGASWGSTLSLAYGERHPERVSEMILFAVTAGRPWELEWITRDVGKLFPEQWERFRDAVPEEDRDGNLAAAYAKLLAHPDPQVRHKAARDWMDWEDTHVSLDPNFKPSPRHQDPEFLMPFARLVTHYWGNNCFLEEDLVANVDRLHGIPGVLIHGKYDVSGPLETAWQLHQAWPGSELHVIDEGHGGLTMIQLLGQVTDRLAA